jgi:hypothetical protein
MAKQNWRLKSGSFSRIENGERVNYETPGEIVVFDEPGPPRAFLDLFEFIPGAPKEPKAPKAAKAKETREGEPEPEAAQA